MKIAIEAQRIFRPNKHGMDFVALESIRELQKADTQNEYYILVSPGEDHCLQATENFRIVELGCPSYPLWEQVALPRAITKIKPDLLHCTSNTAPMYCSVPLILTLHDIIFLEPKQSGNKSWYQNMGRLYRRLVVPRILSRCRKIITVSEFERERIRQTLQLPKGQIVTVYNGFNSRFRPLNRTDDRSRKYNVASGYLLFLGNTDPKKNTPNTLKGYSLYLQQSKKKRPLLIADLKKEVVDTILKEQHIETIKPYLTCPGYIPNTDLVYLYNDAFAFLYTSLRESFGIPLLEAMACGTPVVSSQTSAIPEIAGDGAVLIDPEKPEEIAAALLKLENDPDFYRQQRAYGLQRTENFSWARTAASLLEIYKQTTDQ